MAEVVPLALLDVMLHNLCRSGKSALDAVIISSAISRGSAVECDPLLRAEVDVDVVR